MSQNETIQTKTPAKDLVPVGPIHSTTGTGPTEATPASGETKIEFNETTSMAALSYVGPLVFIPFLLKKSDAFIQYHVRQGFVVFVIGALMWVISNWFGFIFTLLFPLVLVITIGVIILSIIGIINAGKHVEKPLPLIGKWASHFNF